MTNGVLGLANITSAIGSVDPVSRIKEINSINSVNPLSSLEDVKKLEASGTASFSDVLQNAISDSLGDTQTLIDSAEEAEMQFAMGNSDNTHDLQIAQQKANLAVSYTVAVRDKFLDAYKEIMNMQM